MGDVLIRLVLTAVLASTALAQEFQVLGTTVVDQDFFVKGELLPGETLPLFIRRYRKEKGLGPKKSTRLDGSDLKSPTTDTSLEPLGLASGASKVLDEIDESFSCEGLPYGYYSDPANDCRVYHVCQPVTMPAVSRLSQPVRVMLSVSFFCNVNQVFDQRLLTCVPETADFDCGGVRLLYGSSNSQFFRPIDFNAPAADDEADRNQLFSIDSGLGDADLYGLGPGQGRGQGQGEPGASVADDFGPGGGERLQFVDLVKRSFVLLPGARITVVAEEKSGRPSPAA